MRFAESTGGLIAITGWLASYRWTKGTDFATENAVELPSEVQGINRFWMAPSGEQFFTGFWNGNALIRLRAGKWTRFPMPGSATAFGVWGQAARMC